MIKQNLPFTHLDSFNLNDILVRIKLDIVTQSNNRHNRAKLECNLTTYHNDTIEQISRDCGWENINSLKNFFRKATGQSMRDWRTDNK